MRRTVVSVASILLGLALVAPTEASSRKPRLDVRTTPRMAFTPTSVLAIAQLVGGSEHEDFYCPALEWEWGDGSRTVQESDCPPFEPGTKLERHFMARHAYRTAGEFSVRVTLRRASRSIAAASGRVVVHSRFGSNPRDW